MDRPSLWRQALGLGLLMTLVVFTLSACGAGGGGQQQQAKEQAKIRGCVPECVDGVAQPGRLVGSYTTQYFFDGHLIVKFDKPWESQEDQAVEFSAAPFGKWNVHRVLFWSDIYPVEMDNNHELHRAKGVPTTTDGWLQWLKANPNLQVTDPRSVTIGEDDIPAKVVDIASSDEAVNMDPMCPDKPCQEILSWPNSDVFYGFSGSWVLRMYLSDISYGGKKHLLAVAIEGQDPEDLKAFAPTAERVIASARAPVKPA
jgi:hypothetical protein